MKGKVKTPMSGVKGSFSINDIMTVDDPIDAGRMERAGYLELSPADSKKAAEALKKHEDAIEAKKSKREKAIEKAQAELVEAEAQVQKARAALLKAKAIDDVETAAHTAAKPKK